MPFSCPLCALLYGRIIYRLVVGAVVRLAFEVWCVSLYFRTHLCCRNGIGVFLFDGIESQGSCVH
jgi:hypothetical protein